MRRDELLVPGERELSIPEADLQRLWTAYVKSRPPEALELLMAHYAGLAGYLGRKALAKAPAWQNREDILSFAQLGLLDAIQRFDPSHEVKFETYATRRITGAIIDGQRREDPLARQTRRRVKVMQAAVDDLWEVNQRQPTNEEIAAHADMTLDEVKSTMLARQSLNASLDTEDRNDTNGSLAMSMDSEAEVVTMVAELRVRLADRLAELSPRSRVFILSLYCDALSMKDVSEKLGISPAWCRQTRAAAMQELRT